MEKRVQKLSTDCNVKKNFLSPDTKTSIKKKPEKNCGIQREVNSWDCSTPSDNGKTAKDVINDWDSVSDLQETMVVAFDKSDEWDSESEKIDLISEKQQLPLFVATSLDSFCCSNDDVSKVVKKSRRVIHGEDCLIVEDFEERPKSSKEDVMKSWKNSPCSSFVSSSSSVKKRVHSTQSEGTPEDTTIWMIPKSERTESGESSCKLISSSDREKIENLKRFRHFKKKTKSLSEIQKSGRRTGRSSKSENVGSQINYNAFFEGSNLQRKLEIESKNSKENNLGCEKFHRSRVFFTERECKVTNFDSDDSGKVTPQSSDAGNTDEEVLPEENVMNPDERPSKTRQKEEDNNDDRPVAKGSSPVPITSSDSVSDDSLRKFQNGDFYEMELKPTELQLVDSTTGSITKDDKSESWLLFDNSGKYQELSKNEVSLMFNGRSAEAVLQGRQEHLVPTSTLTNTNSLKNLLCNFEAHESLQQVSKEEDTGGDDEFKRLIDLERKMENTLFYIRPETDFQASIRIIPINAEMIHLWKRNRENGASFLSFDTEFDLRHDSAENSEERLNAEIQDSISRNNESHVFSSTPANQQSGTALQNQSADFTKLLIETRVIVDTLTNNFKNLQSRLDGETNRSIALQRELSKLRLLVKTYPENGSLRHNDGKSDQESANANLLTITDNTSDVKSENAAERESKDHQTLKDDNTNSVNAIWNAGKTQDEAIMVEEKASDSNVITVNIYTLEDAPNSGSYPEKKQESDSTTQASIISIEKKMKQLQQENSIITKQNTELKKKLKEISFELEKYLNNSSDQDLGIDEGKELDGLKEQVVKLQEELENLKTVAMDQEETLTKENLLIREEFTTALTSLNDWCTTASDLFGKIRTSTTKLQEIGITVDVTADNDCVRNPKNFGSFLSNYLEQTSRCLYLVKDENFLYEQALKEVQKESNDEKEISSLDQVISGYSDLIDQCKKGQITSETKNKVMEDYFAVIMEKASLMEEMKILKTENEMLQESQLEHYEKLKQTMIALKDRKSEISALESSQKLSEDENSRLAEVLKLYAEEKKQVEQDLLEKSKAVENLNEELKKKDMEIREYNEKLKAVANDAKSFEKSCRLKDEIINKLKTEKEEILKANGIKNNQIEGLNDELKNLKMEKTQLETELTSTKLFVNTSQKEMTDYITHLETLVNSSQESLEKTKQKLKEANQTINRLKNESDILEKQHQCDVKLYNNTKDELDSSIEKLLKTINKLKESEEEQEKLQKKCEFLINAEKHKSEALESLLKEYKMLVSENAECREKIQLYSKDKEELLSEQKDLINKYACLSKEIQKLQEKYRSVKAECNERTDLIRYLEMMLKENFVEYNNRIACLEENISQIIEKIVMYKNGIRGKHMGVDPVVKELRHQLSITCQERKELENVVENYYALMKHLESEIQEREKKVDELHSKLSLEQQKAVEYENQTSVHVLEETNTADKLKIEQLEKQITVAENELGECKRELQRSQTNNENEKKKLELTIADLRSEIQRYQLRIEVMMRNLSNCNKNMNNLISEKRNEEDLDLQTVKKEIQEKDKIILELNDALNQYKAELKLKDGDAENFRKKSFYQNEELKNLQNQIAKLQDAMSFTNKATESQQKERDEMAEKLFQSIKLIMEERSARQTIESLALEKEKNYKNQIEQIKNDLVLKVKECETLSGALEDRKKLVNKLQSDLKKMKMEIVTLKGQVSNYNKLNNHAKGDTKNWEELYTSSSLTQIRRQHVSQERLESCIKELKEVRDINLELRKTEGQYQAKIVQLEDEMRDARLLIKELQGDIKTEKKSKMAFKNMILSAKMEIEKCVMSKQLMSVVAERISRHLDLSEIPSRELLSGFRLSDS